MTNVLKGTALRNSMITETLQTHAASRDIAKLASCSRLLTSSVALLLWCRTLPKCFSDSLNGMSRPR